jgi:hypothetical protein
MQNAECELYLTRAWSNKKLIIINVALKEEREVMPRSIVSEKTRLVLITFLFASIGTTNAQDDPSDGVTGIAAVTAEVRELAAALEAYPLREGRRRVR